MAKKTTTSATPAKADPKSAATAPTPKTTAKPKAAKKSVTKKAPVKKTSTKKVPAKKTTAKKASTKARSTKKPTVSVTVRTDIAPYQAKKDEEYMNAEQRAHFTELLHAWKAELMQEVDRTVSHMKDEASNFPDPADRATQEEEFSLELRTRDRERKLIKKIDSTLEKIEQDDYGYCSSCGVEIGVARLEARLTASQCIDCKTLDEIKEKQERA